jgi:hypothetical protein
MTDVLRRTAVVLGLAASLLAASPFVAASSASAQERVGLPIDALTTGLRGEGLAIGSVLAPESPESAVRLEIVRGQTVVALADVRVCASLETAAAWARARAEDASATALVARTSPPSLADTARGRAGLVVLARHNVAMIVHATVDEVDAARIAAIAALAIDQAPRGAAMPAQITSPTLPRALAVGASAPIALPAELVAARVVATGDAYARRTPNGWMITRTGPGDFRVRITGVDRYLRAAH